MFIHVYAYNTNIHARIHDEEPQCVKSGWWSVIIASYFVQKSSRTRTNDQSRTLIHSGNLHEYKSAVPRA